jgi:hypothetical protein
MESTQWQVNIIDRWLCGVGMFGLRKGLDVGQPCHNQLQQYLLMSLFMAGTTPHSTKLHTSPDWSFWDMGQNPTAERLQNGPE